ncbi:MAG: 2-C-methyl-D-erythritol 2,4-cyclodiphosphate synthase [Planctomycetota bacterium]
MPHQRPASPFRVGIGYDSHRTGAGGPLRLGGIDIPCDRHCIGHSDADVLMHSLTDALLGAIASPDIGRLFPDTAAENAGRDSVEFLQEALNRVASAGMAIGNFDAVILAQNPKLAPHIDDIRTKIAQHCGCDPSQVGLKAKTGEGVDSVGRGESIATRSIVLLVPASGDTLPHSN